MTVQFIEAPAFTRVLDRYLPDDEYAELQEWLARNPEAGPVIAGTGGFRKVRWRDRRRGKGTRGGLRVIYYWFAADQEIWLMAIYDKNEADDLDSSEKKLLREAIAAERRERERQGRK